MFNKERKKYIESNAFLSKLINKTKELDPFLLSYALEILEPLLEKANHKEIEEHLDPFLIYLKAWNLDRNRALRWTGLALRLYRIATSSAKNKPTVNEIFGAVSKTEVIQMLSKTAIDAQVLLICMCMCLYVLDTEDFKEANNKKKIELISAIIRHIQGIENGS